MGIVFIIGFVQAFFIDIILLNKKKKSISDKVLIIWMFIIGLQLLLFYLHYINYYQEFPHLLGLVVPLPFVQGPFLLMYVTSLVMEDQKFNKLFLIHFIPALSYYILLSPKLFLPAEEKLHFAFEVLPVNPPLYVDIFEILVNISGPVYILWSLILLKKHYRHIKENFSYTKNINLKWLRNIILGMAIIWITVLFTNLIDDEAGSILIFSTVTLFTFLIGYYGTRQGIIFTDTRESLQPQSIDLKVKYQKSPFDTKQSRSLLDRLLRFMEEGKPYLEGKITLPQLANRFETNPNYLSQVINENLNQNFYDFINKYRIEEFKKRLKKEDALNYTLYGHARDCGFSSKSSFHEVFKKHTGQTPSQYQANPLSTENH